MGTDPFSNVKTHVRPWDVDSSLDTFLTRVDVAFEFFTKHLVYACLSRSNMMHWVEGCPCAFLKLLALLNEG